MKTQVLEAEKTQKLPERDNSWSTMVRHGFRAPACSPRSPPVPSRKGVPVLNMMLN